MSAFGGEGPAIDGGTGDRLHGLARLGHGDRSPDPRAARAARPRAGSWLGELACRRARGGGAAACPGFSSAARTGQDAPGDQRRGSSGRPTSQPGRYRARGRPSSGRTPARIADGGGHDQSSQPARRPASRGRRCGSRFVSGGAAGPDLALPVDGALQVPSDGDRRATFANTARERAALLPTVSSQSHSSSPMRPIASATARCARYIASSEAERI